METMQEKKKSYAILMERILIKQDQYLFRPKYLIEGTLEEGDMTFENEMDPEFKYKDKSITYSFIDTMNNEYLLSTNSVLLNGDCDESVYYVISEEELLEKYGETLEEAKRNYLAYYSESVVSLGFYVMDTDTVNIIQFNFNNLYNKLNGVTAPTEVLSESEKSEITNFQMDLAFLNKLITDLEQHKGEDVLTILKAFRNVDMETLAKYINSGMVETKEEKIDVPRHNDKYFINALFYSTYSEILDMFDYDAAIKHINIVINLYMNLCLDLDEIEDEKDHEFATNFMYRYIDIINGLLELPNLAAIKDSIVDIREEEADNIMKLNDIYYTLMHSKDREETKEQPKTETTTTSEPKKYVDSSKLKINVKEMKKFFDKRIIGQEDAKRSVILALKKNSKISDSRNKTSCLLVGPTGSGKTLLAETVADYLDIPCVVIDTTQLTVPGYVGKNIEEFLEKLLIGAKGDIKLAERGVVVFDEIDKKGSDKNSDVSGKGVLNVLLPCIQGTTYDVKYKGRTYELSTKNITFYATGAFTDVTKAKLDKTGGYSGGNMGFGAKINEKSKPEDTKYPSLEVEDFIKYGNMPAELMGRLTTIAQLTGHTKESLKQILKYSDISPFESLKEELLDEDPNESLELEWTEEFEDYIVDEALRLKTGARSLNSIIERETKDIKWYASAEPELYSKLLLTVKDGKVKGILFDLEGKEVEIDTLEETEKPKVLEKK